MCEKCNKKKELQTAVEAEYDLKPGTLDGTGIHEALRDMEREGGGGYFSSFETLTIHWDKVKADFKEGDKFGECSQ